MAKAPKDKSINPKSPRMISLPQKSYIAAHEFLQEHYTITSFSSLVTIALDFYIKHHKAHAEENIKIENNAENLAEKLIHSLGQ